MTSLSPNTQDKQVNIEFVAGVFDREDAGRDLMKFKLRNIFKHWVRIIYLL